MDTVQLIRQALEEALCPHHLEIVDESHLHIGHDGAKNGGGHYSVTIVSDMFSGQSRINRHRMVNKATKHLFGSDIHALRIDARTVGESL